MAAVKRSNLVIPELLTEAIQGAFAGVKALSGTGVAAVNFTMPISVAGSKLKGGDTIKIPYFGNLGDLDEIAAEGDALTPQTFSMTSETATVLHAGKAFEITNWAQYAASYADPYSECARQFVEMVMRWADAKLLAAAVASLGAANINDVWSATAPVTLSYDTLVDSRMLWGDEQNDITLLTVHSDVMKNMLKQKDSTGRPLLVMPNDGTISRYCGIPVMASDRNTKDVTNASFPKYTSLIGKRDALAFWAQGSPEVQEDVDVLADTEIKAIHIYGVAHRYSRTPGSTKPGIIAVKTNG